MKTLIAIAALLMATSVYAENTILERDDKEWNVTIERRQSDGVVLRTWDKAKKEGVDYTKEKPEPLDNKSIQGKRLERLIKDSGR